MTQNTFLNIQPVPPFKTLEEEAEYWDTHDTVTGEPLEIAHVWEVDNHPWEYRVALTPALRERFAEVVRRRNLPADELLRIWIEDKVDELSRLDETGGTSHHDPSAAK